MNDNGISDSRRKNQIAHNTKIHKENKKSNEADKCILIDVLREHEEFKKCPRKSCNRQYNYKGEVGIQRILDKTKKIN